MPRPPIPTELSRRVLIEAGHRCAIPTCRNPDVDLHHIVPWERCKSHDFDNLIALCPNCHRRAHNGEIDRKSLLLYKLQLASVGGLVAGGGSPPISGVTVTTRWSTNQLSERVETPNRYEVSVEFPQFVPDEGELGEINTLIRAHAIELVQNARCLSLSDGPAPDDWWSKLENVFAGVYEILLFERSFLSLKYTHYEYGAGAAHGHSGATAYNYRFGPLVRLHHSELFRDAKAALEVLSKYCVESIEAQKRVTAPDEWVRRGCAPEWDNFGCLNLLRGGLLVTFKEYQVGPYSEGAKNGFCSIAESRTVPKSQIWGWRFVEVSRMPNPSVADHLVSLGP